MGSHSLLDKSCFCVDIIKECGIFAMGTDQRGLCADLWQKRPMGSPELVSFPQTYKPSWPRNCRYTAEFCAWVGRVDMTAAKHLTSPRCWKRVAALRAPSSLRFSSQSCCLVGAGPCTRSTPSIMDGLSWILLALLLHLVIPAAS